MALETQVDLEFNWFCFILFFILLLFEHRFSFLDFKTLCTRRKSKHLELQRFATLSEAFHQHKPVYKLLIASYLGEYIFACVHVCVCVS